MGKGNKKAVGKNADILQQKTQEMMQRARLINKLKMDISVELILLLDSEFTISVASDLGGPGKVYFLSVNYLLLLMLIFSTIF